LIPSASKTKAFGENFRPLLTLGLAALLAELAYAILNLSALPMYVTFTLNQGSTWA